MGEDWVRQRAWLVTVGNLTIRLDPEDEFDVTTTRLQLGVHYHFAAN